MCLNTDNEVIGKRRNRNQRERHSAQQQTLDSPITAVSYDSKPTTSATSSPEFSNESSTTTSTTTVPKQLVHTVMMLPKSSTAAIYSFAFVFCTTVLLCWPVQSSYATKAFPSSTVTPSSELDNVRVGGDVDDALNKNSPTPLSTKALSGGRGTGGQRQRGKYIGTNVQPKDLYEAFQEIQNDYQQRAFSKELEKEWKLLTPSPAARTKTCKKKKKVGTNDDDKDNNNQPNSCPVTAAPEVAILTDPDDPNCPYVRMSICIPVPVKDCWNFLELDHWDQTMPEMDPFYEGLEVHGDYSFEEKISKATKPADDGKKSHSHHWWQRQQQPQKTTKGRHHQVKEGDDHIHRVQMKLARKRTKRILTFSKRDFVFLSVSELTMRLKDGSWVSGTVSVNTPTLPRQPYYTRAYQDSIAFYKPIQVFKTTGKEDVGANENQMEEEEHTQLTIVCRIDLNDNSVTSSVSDGDNGDDVGQGGWIPMWLYVKTIGVTGARSITNMRDVLVKEHQKQLLLEQEAEDDTQKEGIKKAAKAVPSSIPAKRLKTFNWRFFKGNRD